MNKRNQCHPKTLINLSTEIYRGNTNSLSLSLEKPKTRSDKHKPLKATYDPETLSYSLTQFFFSQHNVIKSCIIMTYMFIAFRQTVTLLTESTSSCRSKELLRRQPRIQHPSLHQRICLPLLWKASPGLCITCYLCYFTTVIDCRIECALKCRSCVKPQLHDLRNPVEMNTSMLGRVAALLIRIQVEVD